jgi:hypothetical protein
MAPVSLGPARVGYTSHTAPITHFFGWVLHVGVVSVEFETRSDFGILEIINESF